MAIPLTSSERKRLTPFFSINISVFSSERSLLDLFGFERRRYEDTQGRGAGGISCGRPQTSVARLGIVLNQRTMR
jgi:hypothetical protein